MSHLILQTLVRLNDVLWSATTIHLSSLKKGLAVVPHKFFSAPFSTRKKSFPMVCLACDQSAHLHRVRRFSAIILWRNVAAFSIYAANWRSRVMHDLVSSIHRETKPPNAHSTSFLVPWCATAESFYFFVNPSAIVLIKISYMECILSERNYKFECLVSLTKRSLCRKNCRV